MPDRTCVACRTRRPVEALWRLVWSPERTVVVSAHGGGRGAWVCSEAACVAQIEARPRGLGRALRHTELGPAAVRGLLDRVRVASITAVRAHLALCARAGEVVSGRLAVEGALEVGGVVALVVATDASAIAVRAAADRFGPAGVIADVGLDRIELGRLLHKGSRAVLAVRAGRPGSRLACELRCRRALG